MSSNRDRDLLVGRRSWLIASIAAVTSLGIQGKTSAQPNPNGSLDSKGRFRVRAELDISGEIRLKSQSPEALARVGKTKADRTAPIKAKSTIDYDEQFVTTARLQGCKSYQHFHEASSEIQIDRNVTKTTLREQCRDILRLGSDQGVLTTCTDAPLFAAERDLVELPINTMFLEELLTDQEVNVLDKWSLSSEASCRLLNLDAIHEGKLLVCLVDADAKTAQLEINGTVAASVRQVPTSIAVEAKAQLDRQSGTIAWLAANLDETREISESEPGFHVMAQIRLKRMPIDEMTSGLTLERVAGRVDGPDSIGILQFQSDLGYYRFLASRKWSTYRDNGEEATLRFVVSNRVVSQCNVTNMIDFEPGRQLSMDGFLIDVKKALSANSIEIVESAEKISANKLRLLRVVSRGTIQGVDIRWIHYHVSNDNGRRLVLAFTLNEANLDLFAAEDEQILGAFELLDWPTKLDAKAIEAAAKNPDPKDPKSTAVSQPKTTEGRPKLSR
jgi:hypothetical protein